MENPQPLRGMPGSLFRLGLAGVESNLRRILKEEQMQDYMNLSSLRTPRTGSHPYTHSAKSLIKTYGQAKVLLTRAGGTPISGRGPRRPMLNTLLATSTVVSLAL